MPLTLRPATPADLEALLALARQCPEAPQWPPAAYAPYCAAEPRPPLLRIALLALCEAEPQGYAAAALLLDGEQNRCELETLAVLPAARRQGVGAALVRAILAWAARNGARRLALEVRAGNLPALRLYQRLGLALEGRRPAYYSHPVEDALLLSAPVTMVSPAPPFSTNEAVEDKLPRC